MVLQTSLADLGDTLSSRPLAFAVFSGSSSSTEYPHSGMVGHDSVTARIFKGLWLMKKNGYEETTIMATDQRLKLLARNVNLDDPEEVKDFIAKQSWSPYFKNAVSYAYDKYVKANGLSWNITIYRTHHRLPKIPTTEQVNMIIAETRCLRNALAFSIIRDTGIRPIELHKLTLKHIDLEKGILYPSSAKMGEGR